MGFLFLPETVYLFLPERFVPGRYLKMGIQGNENSFISMILFYSYNFLKMRIQGKCVSFYFCGSF